MWHLQEKRTAPILIVWGILNDRFQRQLEKHDHPVKYSVIHFTILIQFHAALWKVRQHSLKGVFRLSLHPAVVEGDPRPLFPKTISKKRMLRNPWFSPAPAHWGRTRGVMWRGTRSAFRACTIGNESNEMGRDRVGALKLNDGNSRAAAGCVVRVEPEKQHFVNELLAGIKSSCPL